MINNQLNLFLNLTSKSPKGQVLLRRITKNYLRVMSSFPKVKR